MRIEFDTTNPHDVVAVLRLLGAHAEIGPGPATGTQASAATPVVEPAAPAAEPDAAKPVAKKAAAKKAASPVAAVPDPEPEPAEPTPASEDADDEAEFAALMKTAVRETTRLVSGGRSSEVKAALADLNVARVSELTAENIGAFIGAVEIL